MVDMAEQRKILRSAPIQLENLEAAKKLALSGTAKAFQGTGGEALKNAASFFNSRLGTAIDVKGVADASELESRLFRGILDNLKKMDPNPTENQQKALRTAIGSLGSDPNALPRILDTFIDATRQQVDAYNSDVSSAEERGIQFPYEPRIKLPSRSNGIENVPANAKQAPDGNYYVPDPNRPGKYLQVMQ
jgi:hypothetical protein